MFINNYKTFSALYIFIAKLLQNMILYLLTVSIII